MRREELAARAGLNTTWCAWLEQGRDIGASPKALARLAVALALTPAERAYLFQLASRRDPEAPSPGTIAEAPASVRALIAAVAQPAYGLDRLWNARCWNPAAEDLFAGWLGPGQERNLLRYTFTDPSARALLPDWEERARRLLAEFRGDYGRAFQDPGMTSLIDRLRTESALFARAWAEESVVAREGGLRRFQHPVWGLLAYAQYRFTPLERPDFKLVTLWPVAEGT